MDEPSVDNPKVITILENGRMNVSIGRNPDVGQYVVLGKEKSTESSNTLMTTIGDDCVIRSHSVIYEGNSIGNNFQTGHHVLIRENNNIGSSVSIGTSTVIEHHVFIGDKVRIHSQAFIPEYTKLQEGCWIGPNVVITNARYPNRGDTKEKLESVCIGKGAVIGGNCTILPGVQIGEFAIVGAGSVVTKDVDSGVVVFGNPAVENRKL